MGTLHKKINANVANFHINMVKQKVGKNGVKISGSWNVYLHLKVQKYHMPQQKVHMAISSLILSISVMNIVMNFNTGWENVRYGIIYHGMNHLKITFACCGFMYPKQKSVLTSLWMKSKLLYMNWKLESVWIFWGLFGKFSNIQVKVSCSL